MTITVNKINYIDINDVLTEFENLTGWEYASGGIWNASFKKPVFDVDWPDNAFGHVMQGESKYQYKLNSPEDDVFIIDDDVLGDKFKNPNDLKSSTETHDKHGTTHYYKKIRLHDIICCLMQNQLLPVEDALYFHEW